jgi:hypothetical protein
MSSSVAATASVRSFSFSVATQRASWRSRSAGSSRSSALRVNRDSSDSGIGPAKRTLSTSTMPIGRAMKTSSSRPSAAVAR